MGKIMKTNKKIEDGVVSGYKKIEDKFVERFLTDDNSPKDGGKVEGQ